MKDWEAKFLGFTAPWWLLLQMAIPDFGQGTRSVVGVVSILVGTAVALYIMVSEPSSMKRLRLIAGSFLVGVASIIVAPFALFALYLFLALLAALASGLGVL